MYLTKDGSIVSDKDEILFFSIENFIENIGLGNDCFICGAKEGSKEFNDEHILPKWLLKKYNLFHSNITLPNLKTYRYDQYKIPCCVDCNKLLKTTYEDPISYAFSKDKKHLKEFIKTNVKLIFNWLILIHLKTFLGDKKFKYDFKKDQKIGDYYDWEILHHLHCIARTCYTNIPIDSNVFGSFLILPALQGKDISNFDFLNIYLGCTVLIRLGDIAIIIVGNDSSITLNSHLDLIKKISSPLNPVQLRELATRFAYTNIMLKERPNYYTHKNAFSNQMEIKAKVPEYYEIEEGDPLIFGKMFYHYIQDIFKETRKTKKISEIISHIKKGKYSYLINEKREFIKNK